MKSAINLLGIILIIAGILALGYQGFTYTTREQVAQIGDLKVTAETQKTMNFPPIYGALALAAGVVLVVVGRR